MEICWITENYPPNKGGMARSCDRIVSGLRKHHTVHIFHFTNKWPAFSSQAQLGGSYTALPVYEDSAHTLNVLWTFLQNNRPYTNASILVSFGSHLCLRGLPQIAQWSDKKLLTCLRGNDFDSAIFSPKKQHLLYALEHSAAVACVTSEKARRIEAMKINDHVFFTQNAINLEEWRVLESDRSLSRKLKQSIPMGKICFGFIGYLKQKKGVDYVLDAIENMSLKAKVHLHFVGETEELLTMRLAQNDFSYTQNAPISQTELIANYLICDAVVIPSLYDGMPNVLFEAGALQVPILAGRTGGLVDVLDAQTAFMFDPLSSKSLMESISKFLQTTLKEKEKRAQSLLKKIKDSYTPEQEIANYLSIFNQLKS